VRISEEKRRKKETPAAKYNGLSYRVAIIIVTPKEQLSKLQ